MSRLASRNRTARGAAVAFVLVLAVAAPATAAQPTHIWHGGYTAFDLPAGTACAFDVQGQPDNITMLHGLGIRWDLSDGAVVHFTRAKGAYVNMATGAQYPTEDTFRDVSTYDESTGILVGLETGQTTWSFLPGDIGPFGVVGENGALYHFIGTVSYTYDLNVFQVLDFSYAGSVEDVCAALS
jgi:hypothetical protein